MKTKVTILKIVVAMVLLLNTITLFSQTGFNQDEELFASIFVDPTLEDEGFQFGADITKELEWGFISLSTSAYPELKDGYLDIVCTPGLAFSFFENRNLQVYAGGRMGVAYRGGNGYGLVGLSLRLQVKVLENVYLGLQLWADHREDQKDEFYGDSDGYKPGLVFTSPTSQENGAGFITFKLN